MSLKLIAATLTALATVIAAAACSGHAPAGEAIPVAPPTFVGPQASFDLSHFKLTLPVNSNGGTDGAAAQVSNAQLNASPGYASRYFYTSSAGAMVFYAPSNGAVTTPGVGSDHARSELRELYRVNGPTEWTNEIGGSMMAECRINRTSVNSDVVIIGQIHGLSSVLLLLYYNPNNKQIRARAYATPGSAVSQAHVLATGVDLNQAIDYSIQWIGSTLSVTVNGAVINLATDPSWNGVPVYFKAGAYSAAPNTRNPAGDATQVSFFSLHIQH